MELISLLLFILTLGLAVYEGAVKENYTKAVYFGVFAILMRLDLIANYVQH